MRHAGMRVFFVSLCATAFAIVASDGRGQRPDESQHRVLLLRNGHVLAGGVTESAGQYLVTLPLGEVRVPLADVEFVCNSLVEVYLRRRAAIRFGTADDHLEVAAWCLRHGLHDEAEAEAARARALQPDNPRLAVVEHQVSVIRNPPHPLPAVEKRRATSGDQLDQLVRNLPAGTVEEFTKSVQPLLVNSCSARSCHGGGDNEFQLMRYSRGSVAPQRLTLRNLESALRWVDTGQPGSSRLLQGAIEPHGSSEQAVLSRDSAAYRHLVRWVLNVTGGTLASEAPKTVFASDSTLSQTVEAEPVRADLPASNDGLETESDAPSATAADPNTGGIRARDPFDPDQFNRRFHGGAQ